MGAGFAPGLGQVIWATIAKAVWKPVAALLAVLGIYIAGRQGASQRAKSEAYEDDHEHAADIRKRVRDDRAERLRKLDDAGWRD
jgi:hypothetical protein